MRVRICIAVDDVENQAAAKGWEVSRFEEELSREDMWSLMGATAEENQNAGGNPPNRFCWVEVEIPPPDSPLEAEIMEVHRARQARESEVEK